MERVWVTVMTKAHCMRRRQNPCVFFVREKPYMQTLSPVFSASAILVQYKAKSTSVLFAPALVLNEIFHLVVWNTYVSISISRLQLFSLHIVCAIFCIFLRSSVSIILVCFVLFNTKFIFILNYHFIYVTHFIFPNYIYFIL